MSSAACAFANFHRWLRTVDFAGHRTGIERGSRVWKYGYDKNGNMVSEQVPGSPNPPLSDAAFTTTFAYDDLDRVASKLIGQRDLEAADQAPFASGRVTSQVVQKGSEPAQVVRQDLAYLGNDDPSSLDHWLGATNHKHFEFSYDLRHQLTGVTETAAGGAFSASYAYGPAGRFAQATEAALALPGSEVKPRDVGYRYEGTDPEEVTALVGATDGAPYANYEYDEAGNQTFRCEGVMEPHHVHRPHSPIICNGDSADFFYDGKDQMRRATKMVKKEKLKGSEEYWYDAFGQRVATLQRDKTGAPTELIWWLDDSEAHYDEAGNLLHVYSYLSLGTPVARVDRRNNDHTKLEFQFHGLANNTLAAVDEDGTINASFDYAPFGEIIESVDAGGKAGLKGHRRRMNDKFVDEVSELHYYGFRYYDPTAMTWTQSNPLYRFAPDFAGTGPRRADLYGFVLENPLRYRDPDGRDPPKRDPTSGVPIDCGLNPRQPGCAPSDAPTDGPIETTKRKATEAAKIAIAKDREHLILRVIANAVSVGTNGAIKLTPSMVKAAAKHPVATSILLAGLAASAVGGGDPRGRGCCCRGPTQSAPRLVGRRNRSCRRCRCGSDCRHSGKCGCRGESGNAEVGGDRGWPTHNQPAYCRRC